MARPRKKKAVTHRRRRQYRHGARKNVTRTRAIRTLRRISAVLWPGGRADNEGDALEQHDAIMHVLISAGYGPRR